MIINNQIKVDIENLKSTEKTRKEIKHLSSDLSLRERQFLIMLTSHENTYDHEERDVKMSFCNNLVSKIDIDGLIERGYLSLIGEFSFSSILSENKLSDSYCLEDSFCDDTISSSRPTIKDKDTYQQNGSDYSTMKNGLNSPKRVSKNVANVTEEQELILRLASGNFDS